jgi:hypothetical protein
MVWSDLEKDYCTCVNGKLYFEGLDKSSWIKIVQSSHPNETLEHLDKYENSSTGRTTIFRKVGIW